MKLIHKSLSVCIILILLLNTFPVGVTPVYAATLTVTNSAFSVNNAQDVGGGIYNKPARAEMIGLEFGFESLSGWKALGSAGLNTGWLQLTPASTDQAGAAFFNTAYPTEGNIFDIQFDYASYGGSGDNAADGLTFFMLDGSMTPTVPGGSGGGLGYTGISGGLFGVGFDDFGTFGGQAEETTDNVAVRGATSAGNPLLVSVITGIQTTNRDDAKHVRITVANNKVSVWIDDTLHIDQLGLSSPLPQTVKFGFSGATHSYYNIHEVDNLMVYVSPSILHVKPDGYTDWPCGQDWVTACALQTALTNAAPGHELWVMKGVYKPTTSPTDPRAATFQLKDGVAVYGGFAGTETSREQRAPAAYLTVLSGDIDNNDSQKPVIKDLATVTGNDTNSYHVVTGATGATLDGFTITGGFADGGDIAGSGGGMSNISSSPMVANTTFSGNFGIWGGGMSNVSSSPTLTNVTFSGNSATIGGGMLNDGSNPTVTNATFIGNIALANGGGMENIESNPTVTNVTFSGNRAEYSGGGMYNTSGSSPTVTNVTFSGNIATEHGGGMYNLSSNPTIANTTFSGNEAPYGGGMYNEGSSPTVTNVTFSGNKGFTGIGMYNHNNSSPTVTNVILWDNTRSEVYNSILSSNTPTFKNSVVQGSGGSTNWNTDFGTDDGKNLDTDPKLGALGYYGGFTQTIPLLPGSSAIDTANNLVCAYPPVSNRDQRGMQRPVDGDNDGVTGCDIGAYERSGGVVYYVKPNATGNCASWQNACSLPTALGQAPAGSEIWVMQGVHKPGTSRAATFQLKSGVEVYGGFAGTETSREQRDPATYLTVLSGDIDNNDINTDGNNIAETTANIQGNNSYHVVTGATGATLDGFTITGGFAEYGGGMYNEDSSPTVTNVTFSGSRAEHSGGGMFNYNNSNPTVTNVTFSGNTATVTGGGMYNASSNSPTVTSVTFSGNYARYGGGMSNVDSSPTLTNVTFSRNIARYGGGMRNVNSSPTIANTTFSDNRADDYGGGMYNDSSSPTVENVTFSGNTATTTGGGMYNEDSSNPTVTNVTFSGNEATNGGGMYNTSGSSPTVTNVILWGDTGSEIAGTATVTYSVVQGGNNGTGNLSTDPILGALGYYGGSTQTFPLLAGSSAVNAGDNAACPSTDQNGVTRPSDGICDIGAFELDLRKVEEEARTKLKAALELRLALSPYQGDNDFDTYVANFNYTAGLDRSYNGSTLQAQIDQADADLRLARSLYGFLVAYDPPFRSDAYFTGNPPPGYSEALCDADESKEDPNPPDPTHTGQVLDPVIDWCDFPARLRQSVREAAYMHMIFGQQFMTDALGLQFSGTTLLGAESAVRQEAARLDAAKYQYARAESMLNESLDTNLGNGCYVSDYFTQSEWSLFSRAIEGQETVQHQMAVRLTYLDVPQTADGPQQRRDVGVEALRVAASDGYIKLIGMAAGQSSGSTCAASGGERPDGALAAEMAINLANTRNTANEMKDGRNIFGFDVTFTPARQYTSGTCINEVTSNDAGLYQTAVCAAQLAQDLQDAEAIAERDYNNAQAALLTEVKNIQYGIDEEILSTTGCTTPDWGCVTEQKEKLNRCLSSVGVYPATADANFDTCINDTSINNGTARYALLDLRSIYMQQYSITQKASNINERIQLSDDANATVTEWLGKSGGFETAARVSSSALDMISCFDTDNDLSIGAKVKNVACGIAGGVNIGLQATAGALSTAADVQMADAENHKETQNLLLDMQELLIDAYGASQQFASKYAEYQYILDTMDYNVLKARQQRAYFEQSPANDPSYRIVLDSTRLQFTSQLDLASKLTYLAARRAEYEYGARLNASNIRFSDIYRARTAGDLLTFLSRLNSVTSNLPAGIPSNLSAQNLTYSVAQNWLHLTDEALIKEGFTTPEEIEAERTRRFREWVAENTVPNNFETPYDNKPVLKFSLSSSLLEGGSFAQLINQGYDGYWLITVGGIGSPKATNDGFSANLLSEQSGLGYRAIRVSQGGTVHLRSQAGCIFDYRLIAPASLLGLDWPVNQLSDTAIASFRANVNEEIPYTINGMRTELFQGRPASSTGWDVAIFSGAPAWNMRDMDLQQLTDIELNFSIVYASRTPADPELSACTRIDW